MASESRKTGFPEFLGDVQSAEGLRRHFIDGPLGAAQQAVLGSVAELATLIGMLPDAFAASQQRELSRILKSGDDKDPRVVALQASIEQADVLRATARRGDARLQRALGALVRGGDVFLGFVSDGDLAPLAGLTVRLTDTKAAGAKTFTATTEADGSFSIDLGTKTSGSRDRGAKARSMSVLQRIAGLFAEESGDETAVLTPMADPEAGVGQVDVLRNETLLYRDPAPVVLKAGSIYREYVIPDATPKPPSASPAGPSRPTRGKPKNKK